LKRDRMSKGSRD